MTASCATLTFETFEPEVTTDRSREHNRKAKARDITAVLRAYGVDGEVARLLDHEGRLNVERATGRSLVSGSDDTWAHVFRYIEEGS